MTVCNVKETACSDEPTDNYLYLCSSMELLAPCAIPVLFSLNYFQNKSFDKPTVHYCTLPADRHSKRLTGEHSGAFIS